MTDGAIAQLGERNTGSVEVGSSILPSSTKYFFTFLCLAMVKVGGGGSVTSGGKNLEALSYLFWKVDKNSNLK